MPRGFDDIKIFRRYAAYVVFEGFEPGVYATWEEADAQVKGFRKNKHKGFLSIEKARRAYKRYLKEKKAISKPKSKPKKQKPVKRSAVIDDDLPPWDID
ncbi:MAG: hypothetical protein CL591_05310 [Alteromonas sp.]|nr:hypothetical protein [Alteromonas sp.]|tara:strand:- start:924 stop:1220 length:297 start_codon:yes stop_codon:yes gene_type:complete